MSKTERNKVIDQYMNHQIPFSELESALRKWNTQITSLLDKAAEDICEAQMNKEKFDNLCLARQKIDRAIRLCHIPTKTEEKNKLQKQVSLLTLGLLQEKQNVAHFKAVIKDFGDNDAAPDLLAACKAIVRDFEAEDSEMVIDPASCVHIPNHTDLCPYWLAKQAIAKAELPEEVSAEE